MKIPLNVVVVLYGKVTTQIYNNYVERIKGLFYLLEAYSFDLGVSCRKIFTVRTFLYTRFFHKHPRAVLLVCVSGNSFSTQLGHISNK